MQNSAIETEPFGVSSSSFLVFHNLTQTFYSDGLYP